LPTTPFEPFICGRGTSGRPVIVTAGALSTAALFHSPYRRGPQ
jgi:hypothetical protein